jgi:hypothetical protein
MIPPRAVRLALAGVVALGAASLGGRVARAQQPAKPPTPAKRTPCSFSSDRFSTDTVPGGAQVTFAAGSVVIRCPARGIVVRGDSAERRPDGEHMIGHAIYDEPRFHVTADFLNYLSTAERVVAVGNVNARLPSGSTMVGPIAEWFRVTPTRPREEMFARSRPTIKVVQKDTTAKPGQTKPASPADTTTIVAETVHMLGDSLIYAGGQVVITRTDISASADSAFLDQTKETMRLLREPVLAGKKDRPFTLKGDLIDLFSKDRKLDRVIARSNAVATSDSMTLKSDTIDLRVKNDLLDHAYVWGRKSLARATSPSQNLLADSLDVTMPGQKVRLMRALGHAFAQGKPDTARFTVEKPDTTDWLRGDTITAHFDTLATKDTAKTPNIRQLFALGRAASWYHLPASDTTERRPAINEVSAKRITIDFDKKKVATVTAVDSVVGVYVEPRADTTRRTNATNAAGKAPAKPATKGTQPAPKTPPKTPAKPPPPSPVAPALNSSIKQP